MRFIQIANLLFLSVYIFAALSIGTALIVSDHSSVPVEGTGVVSAEQIKDNAYLILAQNAHLPENMP